MIIFEPPAWSLLNHQEWRYNEQFLRIDAAFEQWSMGRSPQRSSFEVATVFYDFIDLSLESAINEGINNIITSEHAIYPRVWTIGTLVGDYG